MMWDKYTLHTECIYECLTQNMNEREKATAIANKRQRELDVMHPMTISENEDMHVAIVMIIIIINSNKSNHKFLCEKVKRWLVSAFSCNSFRKFRKCHEM